MATSAQATVPESAATGQEWSLEAELAKLGVSDTPSCKPKKKGGKKKGGKKKQ